MRQATRALGWATTAFWIVIAVFMVTCLYSAIQVIQANMGGSPFGVPDVSSFNGTATVSLPFSFNNTGFYDISELNVTSRITEYTGVLISASRMNVSLIAAGSHIEETHNMSISLDQIVSKNLTHLLFGSGNFSVEFVVGLKFAHIFPFQVSVDTAMPWGAPFSNLSIGDVTFDYVNQKATIPLSFENDSPYFDIVGNVNGRIYNHENVLVGSGTTALDAKSNEHYEDTLDLQVNPSTDLLELAERGRIVFRFETAVFSFEEETSWGDTPD